MLDLMRGLWTIVILLLGPVAGAVGGRKLREAPPRQVIYMSNALNLVVLGAITAAVDLTHGHRAISLFISAPSVRSLAIWIPGTAALAIVVVSLTLLLRVVLWRPLKRSVLMLLPRSASEKIAFAFLCVLIAVVEEYMYRGFALISLRDWLHSGLLAAALVCLSFALMHGLQDWIAILGTFVQGVVLTIPVFAIHSLMPSVVGHFVVDLFAGTLLLGFLKRFDLVPNET
jgi:membrane protease YdiL (CAAX protease family)